MNQEEKTPTYTAFEGHKRVARGSLATVVTKIRKRWHDDPGAALLVFADDTCKQMDFDLSGSEKDVLQRLQVYLPPEEAATAVGPGRPKLGVVSREISLLPRHWEWLSAQSGGASGTLRRLVDEARKSTSSRERLKQAQERTYKFMSALAGDFPDYEEALRALYAKDKKKFDSRLADWPRDIRIHAQELAEPVFE